MFEKLRAQVERQGATLEVLGVGTTGYAKDILKGVLQADVAVVLERMSDRDCDSDTVKTAFTKETDIFTENSILYLDPILNLQDQKMCAEQMPKAWAPVVGLSREENQRALDAGFRILHECEADIRRQARQTLDQLEREDRHRNRDAGACLSSRSGFEPRNHGRVSEAGLSSVFPEHAAP